MRLQLLAGGDWLGDGKLATFCELSGEGIRDATLGIIGSRPGLRPKFLPRVCVSRPVISGIRPR